MSYHKLLFYASTNFFVLFFHLARLFLGQNLFLNWVRSYYPTFQSDMVPGPAGPLGWYLSNLISLWAVIKLTLILTSYGYMGVVRGPLARCIKPFIRSHPIWNFENTKHSCGSAQMMLLLIIYDTLLVWVVINAFLCLCKSIMCCQGSCQHWYMQKHNVVSRFLSALLISISKGANIVFITA